MLFKVVMLQNVSDSSAKFQLMARPNYSHFTVMIERKTQTASISPGMYIKLIIFFRCDILDEPEEMLVINVQQGRSVIIKLRGYRDPPLLRVINIPYFQYSPKELQTMIRNTEWIVEIPYRQTDSCEEYDVSNNNMLILPSFAMWPAYFTLKPQEHIYLYLYFFPDAHGMH
ncbi:Uncharacterized protein DBV15_06252, partial [Temnothorax longispinosus]